MSGCWDREEVDRKAYVIAIGMDKADEENLIQITYLIANPEFGSQQQSGGIPEPPQEIISFNTNDLISARSTGNAVIAKEISYDLLTTMIISEKFAKDKDFIRWMYDATKGMEIRRDVNLIVTREQARKFITKNKPKLETRPHKYFDLILQRGFETGMIPNADLMRFFRITEADSDLFLAIYGSTENTARKEEEDEDRILAGQFDFKGETNVTSFSGSAVFKEGKMIGKLTGEDTRFAIILNDTLNATFVFTTFPDPFDEKYRVAARVIKDHKNKVIMDLKKETPKIDVTIPLDLEILTDHSMVNYAKHQDKREKLKKSITKRLEKKLDLLVKKTQEDFKAEPFGWSLTARKQFQTIPEYEAFDWMKTYPDMEIDIHVEIKFTQFGRQTELPSKSKVRD